MLERETLGFIGLGIMGFPMAENLLKAGYALTVYNRSRSRAEPLRTRGAQIADSPPEVARKARIIFLSLGDTQSVLEVCDALLESIQPGSLVVDTTTISPAVSRQIASKFQSKGADFLDAPCTGSKTGAIKGTLTFMVGGEKKAFEHAEPCLRAMGNSIFHVGEQGQGLQVKLTQNLIGALTCQAMFEGFVLARKAGVSPSLVQQVLQASVARSPMIDSKLPLVMSRNFEPHFSLKWMYKDLTLMLESARELQVPLPATAVVHELFKAAMAAGHGEEDFASAVTVLEQLAGTEVTEKSDPASA